MLKAQKKSSLDNAEYVIAGINFFPFKEGCCDTLIVDPPFSFYCRFKWILNLVTISRKKVILSHPQVNLKIPKFDRELFFINSKSIFLRLWWVFTKGEF
ncbi:unnamed protein product, partial [marine sediment metagenome]